VVGALGISGPIWRLTDQVIQARAKIVKAAANRLSAEFGVSAIPNPLYAYLRPTLSALLALTGRLASGNTLQQ